MTLEDAAIYQEKNFGFSGLDHDLVNHEHRLAHIVLASLCVYNPKLRMLMPEIDSETGFLKQSGYNGFLNGELYVSAVEGFIELLIRQVKTRYVSNVSTHDIKGLNEGQTEPTEHGDSIKPNNTHEHNLRILDYMETHLAELIEEPVNLDDVMEAALDLFNLTVHRFKHQLNNNFPAWLLASISKSKISVAEVKKHYGWGNGELGNMVNGNPEATKLRSTIRSNGEEKKELKNKWGERNTRTQAPEESAITDMLLKLKPLYDYIDDAQPENSDHVMNLIKTMKIRDLHILIVGAETSSNYFSKCGVPPIKTDTKKAAELTAAF